MTLIFARSTALARVFALSTAVAAICLSATHADAARVNRAKGRAVEIQLEEGDEFAKGTKLLIISKGKKVGRAQVVKLKGGNAIAKLLKGKAPKGASVRVAQGSSSEPIEQDTSARNEGEGQPDFLVGFVVGYNLNTQTVSVGDNVKMSGGSFSVKGIADLAVAGDLGLIGRLGLETFSYTGTGTSGNAYSTKLTYISADLLVRYVVAPGSFNPYVAGGIGFAFPMSTTSNILDTSKVNPTTPFYFGGGANMELSKDMYLPINAEYAFLPGTEAVKTNWFAIRAGIAWVF